MSGLSPCIFDNGYYLHFHQSLHLTERSRKSSHNRMNLISSNSIGAHAINVLREELWCILCNNDEWYVVSYIPARIVLRLALLLIMNRLFAVARYWPVLSSSLDDTALHVYFVWTCFLAGDWARRVHE